MDIKWIEVPDSTSMLEPMYRVELYVDKKFSGHYYKLKYSEYFYWSVWSAEGKCLNEYDAREQALVALVAKRLEG